MTKKSFATMPRPDRQPSAEEIEAFEETGRARLMPPAPVSAPVQGRKSVNTDSRIHGNTENRESGNAQTQNRANTETQGHGNVDSRDHGKTETQKSAITETRKHGFTEISESVPAGQAEPAETLVRLTIDLPESVHSRFKAACAAARRKMVQEVRLFIEERTRQLESGAVPPQ